MEINTIQNYMKYEDVLKDIYKIYPRLTENSRTAKIIKVINEFGPCNLQTIKLKAYSDVIQESKLTPEEWIKKYEKIYGIEVFDKLHCYFVKSFLDPNDKENVLYELNDFGKAFLFCFDNLYNKRPVEQDLEFESILAKYKKKIADIDYCIMQNLFSYKNNFRDKIKIKSYKGVPKYFRLGFKSIYNNTNHKIKYENNNLEIWINPNTVDSDQAVYCLISFKSN